MIRTTEQWNNAGYLALPLQGEENTTQSNIFDIFAQCKQVSQARAKSIGVNYAEVSLGVPQIVAVFSVLTRTFALLNEND